MRSQKIDANSVIRIVVINIFNRFVCTYIQIYNANMSKKCKGIGPKF